MLFEIATHSLRRIEQNFQLLIRNPPPDGYSKEVLRKAEK
jgi:hypothetical protein